MHIREDLHNQGYVGRSVGCGSLATTLLDRMSPQMHARRGRPERQTGPEIRAMNVANPPGAARDEARRIATTPEYKESCGERKVDILDIE
ncbi:hypothetical protein BN2475_240050 [Paraburkholderia ribeironis]|uniref:Uncharacterized protein n=1 Tax=Paraburkholderia ribeironis TaxID=1247936 RepID=A0A1N7RY59_9BURK|nr:hypothetical protein [Paraburkholderia ribeironis]SIT40068.1 hypothetical protein BN2475_240050 [Paraburkholderia ribeironis]